MKKRLKKKFAKKDAMRSILRVGDEMLYCNDKILEKIQGFFPAKQEIYAPGVGIWGSLHGFSLRKISLTKMANLLLAERLLNRTKRI